MWRIRFTFGIGEVSTFFLFFVFCLIQIQIQILYSSSLRDKKCVLKWGTHTNIKQTTNWHASSNNWTVLRMASCFRLIRGTRHWVLYPKTNREDTLASKALAIKSGWHLWSVEEFELRGLITPHYRLGEREVERGRAQRQSSLKGLEMAIVSHKTRSVSKSALEKHLRERLQRIMGFSKRLDTNSNRTELNWTKTEKMMKKVADLTGIRACSLFIPCQIPNQLPIELPSTR